jgi:anti-sigma28 factor (negative regulator of flagellin synthesis)
MKVPGSDGNGNVLKRVQDARVSEQSTQRKSGVDKAVDSVVGDTLSKQLAKPQVDTMTISSLGSVLRQELDPSKMIEERKAKVQSIKERVTNGTYTSDSVLVAQSLNEEVTLEVLLSGGALQDGDETR